MNKGDNRMSIIELLKIEFMKVKRSMILPLLLIPPILVVVSGVFSISMYMTPEYTNAWSAMFIQSALLFGYYLLPFSMVVVCVMIANRETNACFTHQQRKICLNKILCAIELFSNPVTYLFSLIRHCRLYCY